ncbi:hypothetical protein ACIBHY_39495 [Nonomuraea sp. NPDC050547]
MSFVLNLQTKNVREAHDGVEPASLSFLSPVTCFSTTSIAVC